MERAELKKLVLATGCALDYEGSVFLGNPRSSVSECAQKLPLMAKPGLPLPDGLGWLCIPTGGSSEGVRLARHDEKTLTAAVEGFCTHFGVSRVNTLDVLPAYHVSGLMARVRSASTGGECGSWSWKQLETGDWPDLPDKDDGWFLSLVPTQLQRLLSNKESVSRLRRFRTILVGGGPLWPELSERAAQEELPIAACYGMTETAAMVVAQKPGDFLKGDRSCGLPMPQTRVEILDETSGAVLPAGEDGLVRVAGENVFRGYWPEAKTEQAWLTDDFGRFDAAGRLTILRRRDEVIITGGMKVHPGEVEALLRASCSFKDVAVVGVPDAEWGSVVVACFPRRIREMDKKNIQHALLVLAPYQWPKRFVTVFPWPRNALGKLNRSELVAAVLRQQA